MPEDLSKDEASQALHDARRLAQDGRFEEALEKHILFHDHALSEKPTLYGVRLSFALADWVELGKKYPKALEKLKSIRDLKTSRLLEGDLNRELFTDVSAINSHLNESSKTVELFKRLIALNNAFGFSIYDWAMEALLVNKEYELAKQYLGDPQKFLDRLCKMFAKGMQLSNHKEVETANRVRLAVEQNFTKEVLEMITIYKETGDEQTAVQIQTDALKTFDHPDIRNVLNKSI